MKRGFILSLCAAALAAMTTPALAAVDAQLNLRYDNPADESAGGTWHLLVQSSAADGISGIQALIDGATGVTAIDTGSVTPNGALWNNTDDVFRFQPLNSGATVEVVTGDELDGGSLLMGVGTGASSPGNIAKDDLFAGAANAWDNSALVAEGTFGATRPVLTVNANEFSGANAVAATIGDISVRGDGVATDGLTVGDVNRDGTTGFADLATIASVANYNQPGGWDLGDIDNDGTVGFSDLATVSSVANYNTSSASPPTAAVPEPSSILLLLTGLSFTMIRKRS